MVRENLHKQQMSMKLRENDRSHPYVRKMVGCGHGQLYTEPCVDCEIVGLKQEYKSAVKAIERITKRWEQLGIPIERLCV